MPNQLKIELGGIKVRNIFEEVENGKIVLPDFQRDFVWPTDQVAKLLESILNGYYINTLLVLPIVTSEEHGPPFPPRTVEGVTNGNIPFDTQMILDGQQRITSIYYAITAPTDVSLANTVYPQLYFLSFKKAVDGIFDEEAIGWRRRDWESSQSYIDNDYGLQIENDIIPFTIFKSTDTLRKWRRGLERYAEETGKISNTEIDQFEDNTDVFHNYEIPIIKLAADTPESKVVRTFERINTQGLELGVFDILTARLWTSKIRLRDLWEETLNRYPTISSQFDSISEERFRELLLKTIALHRGHECNESHLRELSPNNFESDWFQASKMIDRVLLRAKSSGEGGLGITEKFGFPYSTMLPLLANFIHMAENKDAYPDKVRLSKIQQWYWASVFSKRYSGSVDTTSFRDYREVKSWIMDEGKIPDAIENAPQRITAELSLETLNRGGFYRGIMSLIILNRAKDFGTLESIELHQVDDHHIFPISLLRDGLNGKKYEKEVRNCILNRTIIESKSNRYKYKDLQPSHYIREMIESHPEGEAGVRNLLRGHLIDDSGFRALLEDDFEMFLSSRQNVIQEAIKNKVGMDIVWE